MKTIFVYTLGRLRGAILGWGLALAVLGGYLMLFYETFVENQEQFVTLLEVYPKEMFAFFGDITNMFTPSGFLHIEFFSYMPIILGIFAIAAGAGLLAGDEEGGILDLVLAHPVSRTSLYAGRLLGYLVGLAAILALAWLGLTVALPSTELGLDAGNLLLPFLSLFSQLVLFGLWALLLSLLLPSQRMASMTAGLALVGSFFLSSLARIDERLVDFAKYLSPLDYYQGGEALNGLNLGWFWGVLGLAALFALLGWQLFLRRDIRVAGEGSWRVVGWLRGFARRPASGQ